MRGTTMTYLPINQHGLIGDLHTAALVGKDSRVVWLPWPRFDSPSVFASLLDAEHGGDWLLAAADPVTTQQAYASETAVLLTQFETLTGRAELCDWMTPWDRAAPSHDLRRVLRCMEGEVAVVGRFVPRPDYARSRTVLHERANGLYFATHDVRLDLLSTHPWMIREDGATLQTTLRVGEEVRCVLSSGKYILLTALDETLAQTRQFWADWIGKCRYDGLWPEAVRRSAITLKLLTYAPSGAIIAAPTTSLPEWIGGVRNWDYRYTWLRDASLTLGALYVLGDRAEARAFFDWLGDRAQQYGTPLQIMYGIEGEAELTESELEHLEGYRGSKPIRIGNGAYDQSQLDVYGGILDAAYVHELEGDLLTPEQWAALRNELDYVCDHWQEPDHGIWEMRMELQHHVFSKLMCWLALDRGLQVAKAEGWEHDEPRWTQTRDAIRASILAHGWNDEVGAFPMMYGRPELDAGVLIMPMVDFLPPDDPRVVATIEAIDRELGCGPLIYRYRMDDGLPGDEGAFLLCSYWMIEALTMIGRLDEAMERFNALLHYTSAHGLLSEEVDPATGTALGNYPQAFSHIGLINSAWRLTQALREREQATETA
jgi:GH15 family glucan-1,4-alpha-glucosidase